MSSLLSPLGLEFHFLNERVTALEKLLDKKRKPVTLGKKLLILKELKLIDLLRDKFKTGDDFYKFLSLIMDEDVTNIEKYLNHPELVELKMNYDFVIEQFKNFKLDTKNAEAKLIAIEKKK
jgi:hypothetical protein